MASRSSPLHRHVQTPDQGWQISGPRQSGLLTERSQCDHRLEWGLGPCDQGRPDSPIPHTHHTCGLFFAGVCRLGQTALSMRQGHLGHLCLLHVYPQALQGAGSQSTLPTGTQRCAGPTAGDSHPSSTPSPGEARQDLGLRMAGKAPWWEIPE